ncbi:exported hypothetical protein [Burkholderiales bacterium]|nr:exported hypothetical protein [Burkholderiales bacterium]
MLQLFLQSLLIGALLAAAVATVGALLRRAAARKQQGLLAGQALRCVRPLDLSEH